MRVLLITFSHNGPQQNVDAIRRFVRSHPWARLAESTYVIKTKATAQEVYDSLDRTIGSNEGLFVMTLDPDWWGYSPHADISLWLRHHLG